MTRDAPALTSRQTQIVMLLADDMTDRQIAEHLSLSHYTVRTHMRNIRNIYSVNSRAGIVAKAFRRGDIS